ncbi:hypothetical protein SAMN05421810_103363 [Amycolatopsis arida]|uniref:Uncharacterized protein n=1 Tax=Amycolatopsis arida TaxID=587909 RepID=A0A1I5T269_9PSEU|nr:hypothetical protein [Amycolatopsis arida]TDX96258.1 hypothetical protein CLV69_103395 [Amycolatopsis arida]SFP77132.1 hypothetical protein SAMN05421810_103363 [Amycolatopsis arida]
MAALVAWLAISFLRSRFQSVEAAAEQVRKQLYGRSVNGDEVDVLLWSTYPLSEHMIKKLGQDEGFTYRGRWTRGGAATARFARPRQPKRKLSIDV